MTTFDDLVALVPPPAAPIDAAGDWTAVETALGAGLPADFKALVGRYGLGQFAEIILLTPFSVRANGMFDLVKKARTQLDLYRTHRDDWPDDFPYPLYPEPDGLLEWGTISDGDTLCWLTTGEPDRWQVVVWNIREGAHRYDVGAVPTSSGCATRWHRPPTGAPGTVATGCGRTSSRPSTATGCSCTRTPTGTRSV